MALGRLGLLRATCAAHSSTSHWRSDALGSGKGSEYKKHRNGGVTLRRQGIKVMLRSNGGLSLTWRLATGCVRYLWDTGPQIFELWGAPEARFRAMRDVSWHGSLKILESEAIADAAEVVNLLQSEVEVFLSPQMAHRQADRRRSFH